MGTTLWVLSKNKMTEGDDYDHSAVFNAAERLDKLCEHLGVKALSTFFDWTDFNANMGEAEEFPSEDELREKAAWFSPDAALPTLRALRTHLASDSDARAALFEADLQHFSDYLLDELDDCISKLERIQSEADVFHLCVVM
ncbi:MAG: hypothetical protein ACK5PF_05750 [bacterium]|jgi:hypothetical protein